MIVYRQRNCFLIFTACVQNFDVLKSKILRVLDFSSSLFDYHLNNSRDDDFQQLLDVRIQQSVEDFISIAGSNIL